MKNYSAKNTWDSDETAIFDNNQGRSTLHETPFVKVEQNQITDFLALLNNQN